MSWIKDMAKKHGVTQQTMYRRYQKGGMDAVDKPKMSRGEMTNIYKRVHKFRVKVAINRKTLSVGTYSTVEEAKEARDKFRVENGLPPISS